PTPHIYILSLHDALPISRIDKRVFRSYLHNFIYQILNYSNACSKSSIKSSGCSSPTLIRIIFSGARESSPTLLRRCSQVLSTPPDRKSTRLNSSHVSISY